jgi:alpha-methylacyl-CoA racemase
VTLAALEPKFWRVFCQGVGRPDLIEHGFDRPGSEAHAAVSAIFLERTREQWRRFAAEHDCCLEPVLDLGEALTSDQVSERRLVVALDQSGIDVPVRLLGVPIRPSRTPGEPSRAAAPALGEHTDRLLAEAGYTPEQAAALHETGAVVGPTRETREPFLSVSRRSNR